MAEQKPRQGPVRLRDPEQGKGDAPINIFSQQWDDNYQKIENFGFVPAWQLELDEEAKNGKSVESD